MTTRPCGDCGEPFATETHRCPPTVADRDGSTSPRSRVAGSETPEQPNLVGNDTRVTSGPQNRAQASPAQVEAARKAYFDWALHRLAPGIALGQAVADAVVAADEQTVSLKTASKYLAAMDAAVAERDALRAEVERLRQWKAEATEVISGLQDLGKALGLFLGERITGPTAVEAARSLRERAEAAEAKVAAGLALADEWGYPVKYTGPADLDWAINWNQGCNTARAWAASQLRTALSGSSEPTEAHDVSLGAPIESVTTEDVLMDWPDDAPNPDDMTKWATVSEAAGAAFESVTTEARSGLVSRMICECCRSGCDCGCVEDCPAPRCQAIAERSTEATSEPVDLLGALARSIDAARAQWPPRSTEGEEAERAAEATSETKQTYPAGHGWTPRGKFGPVHCGVMLARYPCPHSQEQHDPALPPVDVDVFGYRRAFAKEAKSDG